MSRFPETLPAVAVDILAGHSKANAVAENLIASYWTHDGTPARSLYLLQQAHSDLHELAAAMGYNITPNAKPRRIIAERDQLGAPVWRAHCDDLGSDTSPYGYGATEAEAIADLERLLEEAA